MGVQVTSIISYYAILQELGQRQKEVLLCMRKIQPANNKMILEEMRKHYPNMDINSICGRMKELRSKGIVIFDSIKACPYTKESSKFYKIKSYISECMQ